MPIEMAFDWSREDFAAVSAQVRHLAKDCIWNIGVDSDGEPTAEEQAAMDALAETCKVEILAGFRGHALVVITWDGDNNLPYDNPLAFRDLESSIACFLTWAGPR